MPVVQQSSASFLSGNFFVEPGIEIIGTEDAETLFGSNGGDRLIGMGGDDLFYGYGGGDDLFAPSFGNATLYGGAGNDTLDARGESSLCYGGAGDDAFYLFGPNDDNIQHRLFGGAGIDRVSYAGIDGPLLIDLRRVIPAGSAPSDRMFGIEEVSAGLGNDVMIGNSGANTLEGQRGQDSVYGGYGWDSLDGGLDDDSVFGGAGRDTIEGGRGADRLHGGDGGDVLFGAEGFDTLIGGTGSDLMYGGSSADQFVFNLGSDAGGDDRISELDRILDFQVGSDKIVIEGVAGVDNVLGISFLLMTNGLQIVYVDNVGDDLLIGVRARGNLLTESDITFLFV